MPRIDAVCFDLIKQELNHFQSGFGGISVSPVFSPDRPSKFQTVNLIDHYYGFFGDHSAECTDCLKQVSKQGYVLLDQDVLYRQYSYSDNPLELVMEDKAQLEADRRALERQVRSVTEAELQRRSEELELLIELQNAVYKDRGGRNGTGQTHSVCGCLLA